MKTFAAKKQKLAPAVHKPHRNVHHPIGPVQQAQQVAMRKILRPDEVQAKSDIDENDSKYEQETEYAVADLPATAISDIPPGGPGGESPLQRAESEEPEEELQRQPEEEEEEPIQAKLIQRQTADMHGIRPSRFGYVGPRVKTQQAEIRRILRSTGAQAKLTIGQPNDKYEQEADRLADQVMAMPDPKLQRQPEGEEEEETLQTKPLANQITPLVQRQEELPEEEEEETLQTKTLADQITPLVQRQEEPPEEEEELQAKSKHGEPPTVTPSLESRIHAMKGSGQPLPESTRAFFEPRFGHDFSQVRIHADVEAMESSRGLNALAYTVGRNIVFNTGQYQPHTITGRHLLAHELIHTIQQRTIGPAVQRAMKFEFQTSNVVWRTGGKKRKKLPRKFGPTRKPKHSRFLHKGSKGKPAKGAKEGTAIELQSEARGFVEFETPSWHRKWCAIKKRIQEAVSMVDVIQNKSTVVSTAGGIRTVEFPFDIKHLKKTKHFKQGLRVGESLEVEILDPTWTAKIQASESFALSQFESYLGEHLPSEVASITGSAETILQAANTKKIPDKDLVNLRNFLQIIVEHIKQAQLWNPRFGRTKLAKENISLMSRTNFSSIYKRLLSKDERKLFRKIIKRNAIPKELGLRPKSRVFPAGFIGRKSPGPNIREWLVSIYSQKRDLLSSLGGDNRALGRFNVEMEKGKKHTNLVKFEARATGGHTQSRPVTEWVAFAEEVFKAAYANRSRTGSTELVYDPEKCP